MTRRPSRRELVTSIENLQEETTGDPLEENPDKWPIPDGVRIPVDVAIAAAKEIRSGTDGGEAWTIAAEESLANDLPEVTADGLEALEELGYPAEDLHL